MGSCKRDDNGIRTARVEIGLVLQGGGALGAYEWGAIERCSG